MFVGTAAGNPLVTVLSRALVVGAVCFVVGSVIGHVAAAVVSREVAEHERRFPFPDSTLPGGTVPDDGTDEPGDVAGVSA